MGEMTDREIYAMTARSRLMHRLDKQDAARKRRPPPADPEGAGCPLQTAPPDMAN